MQQQRATLADATDQAAPGFSRIATVLLALNVCLLCGVTYAQNTILTWDPPSSGAMSWNSIDNWGGSDKPNSNTEEALFMSTGVTNGVWSFLANGQTCHSITFSNTVDSTSTIRLSNSGGGGARSLTLDAGANTPSRLVVLSGAAADITIGIGQGPGTAVGDVNLKNDLVIDHDGDGVLKFDAAIYDNGAHTVTKTGIGELHLDKKAASGSSSWFKLLLSEGTVRFGNAQTFRNNITMDGGTLRWASGITTDISGFLVLSDGVAATFDTYGNDVELGTDDIGNGTTASLVKMGSGTLYLNDNTAGGGYSGDTIVSNGTLRLKSGSLNAATTVRISSGAKLSLNSGENVAVESLYLNGVQQVAGTWGHSSSAATYTDDTYFNANTGILTVNSGAPLIYVWDPPAAGYHDWNDGANWAAGSAPNQEDDNDILFMDTSVTNGVAVTLKNGYKSVRSMTFSNTVDSASSIGLNNGDTTARDLRFDTDAGTATLAVQSGAGGDITFGAGAGSTEGDIVLNDDLVIDHGGDGVLKFDADIYDNGAHTVTKTGIGELHLDKKAASGSSSWFKLLLSEGTVRFGNVDTFRNDITMDGGTLRWASGITKDISGFLVLSNGVAATFDTNGNDVELATDDIGDGTTASLVKTGAGELYLNDNTAGGGYSGDTVVSNGTLKLRTGCLNPNTTVRISSGAQLLIRNGDNVAVESLYLNGVQQAAGPWGHSNSSADHPNDIYFSANTGVLTVNSGPPPPPGGTLFKFR